MTPPAFAAGGGGSRPPLVGRVLPPPASFFLRFCDRATTLSETLELGLGFMKMFIIFKNLCHP